MHFNLCNMNVPLLEPIVSFVVSIFPTLQQADEIVLSIFIVDIDSLSHDPLIIFTGPLDSFIFKIHLLLSLALLILVVFFFKILLQSVSDIHLVAFPDPFHVFSLLTSAFKHSLAILSWLGKGHTRLHRLLGRKVELLLQFTVDNRDMLLPKAEQLFIILGEYTVPLVMPINQMLGHICKTSWFAIWILHGIFQPIRVYCEI